MFITASLVCYCSTVLQPGGGSHLIELQWREVLPAHGLLLGVAALLQSLVSGQEEPQPGAGGGGRVLPRQEQTDQHPSDLIVVQGPSISSGGGGV